MIIERLLRVALLGSDWVLYLLIALSVVGLGAALERWVYFRRHTGGAALRVRVERALREGDLPAVERTLAGSRAVEARVLAAALRWRDGGTDAVARQALRRRPIEGSRFGGVVTRGLAIVVDVVLAHAAFLFVAGSVAGPWRKSAGRRPTTSSSA